MNPDTPPPPLPKPARAPMSRRSKVLVGVAIVPACFLCAFIVLRVCGLVRPFFVPTGAMTPAVSAGDHVMMEGMTFLARHPRRGDIVVFRTDGIASLPSGTFYVKRVAGEPGDHLRISQGTLFVNEKPVSLSNAVGQIVYNLPPPAGALSPKTDLTVPDGCYFVLGDNSTNSFDSRFWGSVPSGNIIGRISLCYWPPRRVGGVK
jgi:signal peptidase I